MNKRRSDDAIEHAISMLLEEKNILLSGNLMALKEFPKNKENLQKKLNSIDIDAVSEGRVAVLRAQAEMNAALFEAARSGLENVRQRINSISENLNGFQVYGSDRRVDVLKSSKRGQRA